MIVREIKPNATGKPLRVAAYCRVSTVKESQEASLAVQKAAFAKQIQQHPEWQFVGVYADAGQSGLSGKRPGFQRMLADIRSGKIDSIIVKSISRFGRDIVMCRQVIEDLAQRNVSVYFEKEGIVSTDPTARMLISLSAAIAQDESRSNSDNHHWSNLKRTQMGIYRIGNEQILGYDVDSDGKPTPNQDAWIIRMIFTLYAQGQEIPAIATALDQAGAVCLRSLKPFGSSQIKYILHNEIYVGDRLLQKQNPKNLFTKKPDPRWKKTSRYLKDEHPAIVSRKTWEIVQERLARTGGRCEHRHNSHYLSARVYCSSCGEPYERKTYRGPGGLPRKAWKCRGRGAGKCHAPILNEDVLIARISEALGCRACEENLKNRRIGVDTNGAIFLSCIP